MSFGAGSDLEVVRFPDERLRGMGVALPEQMPAASSRLRKSARGGESAFLSDSCNATHLHRAGKRGAANVDVVAFTVAVFFQAAVGQPGGHFVG